jgi:hypothetical protein
MNVNKLSALELANVLEARICDFFQVKELKELLATDVDHVATSRLISAFAEIKELVEDLDRATKNGVRNTNELFIFMTQGHQDEHLRRD